MTCSCSFSCFQKLLQFFCTFLFPQCFVIYNQGMCLNIFLLILGEKVQRISYSKVQFTFCLFFLLMIFCFVRFCLTDPLSIFGLSVWIILRSRKLSFFSCEAHLFLSPILPSRQGGHFYSQVNSEVLVGDVAALKAYAGWAEEMPQVCFQASFFKLHWIVIMC